MYLLLIIILGSIITSIVVAKNENKKYELFLKNRQERLNKKENPYGNREERKLRYEEYLRSDHWQSIRPKAFERADNKCQLCSSTDRLEVHHNTYKNRGHEKPTDLVVLCKRCHSKFHNRPYYG